MKLKRTVLENLQHQNGISPGQNIFRVDKTYILWNSCEKAVSCRLFFKSPEIFCHDVTERTLKIYYFWLLSPELEANDRSSNASSNLSFSWHFRDGQVELLGKLWKEDWKIKRTRSQIKEKNKFPSLWNHSPPASWIWGEEKQRLELSNNSLLFSK